MSENASEPARRGGREFGCLILVFVAILLIVFLTLLFWRSLWWEEEGAPLPRGTRLEGQMSPSARAAVSIRDHQPKTTFGTPGGGDPPHVVSRRGTGGWREDASSGPLRAIRMTLPEQAAYDWRTRGRAAPAKGAT